MFDTLVVLACGAFGALSGTGEVGMFVLAAIAATVWMLAERKREGRH
jgi:hypothetical protein